MAGLPMCPRMSQNGSPSRERELTGVSGSAPLPFRLRRNSKTPCLPGILAGHPRYPGGWSDRRYRCFERAANAFVDEPLQVAASSLDSINGSSTSNVAPSRPINRTFLLIAKTETITDRPCANLNRGCLRPGIGPTDPATRPRRFSLFAQTLAVSFCQTSAILLNSRS